MDVIAKSLLLERVVFTMIPYKESLPIYHEVV